MKCNLWLGLLCLIISTASASAAQRCSVPLIRLYDNQSVSATIYAFSGLPCSITLNSSRGPVFTTQVVQNAASGRVVVNGNRVIYTSRAGFVGEDHYTYARRGLTERNEPVMATVNVTVQVAKNSP